MAPKRLVSCVEKVSKAGGNLVMVNGLLCLALGVTYISLLHMNVRLKLRTLRTRLPNLNQWGSQASTAMTQTVHIGVPTSDMPEGGSDVRYSCILTAWITLFDGIQSES